MWRKEKEEEEEGEQKGPHHVPRQSRRLLEKQEKLPKEWTIERKCSPWDQSLTTRRPIIFTQICFLLFLVGGEKESKECPVASGKNGRGGKKKKEKP